MVESDDRVLLAGAEDRATLESDLSADVGAYTDGQGNSLCPFVCPSGMPESDKLKLPISELMAPLGASHRYHSCALPPVGLTGSFG